MEALLKIEKLTKNYRDKKANDQISFEVNKGDIVGIIGESGAGNDLPPKTVQIES